MTLPSSLDELIASYDRNAKIDRSQVPTYDDYDKMISDRDKHIERMANSINPLAMVAG